MQTALAAVFDDMAQTLQQRQEALQASEERFRLLVDGIKAYAVVMLLSFTKVRLH
jgi:hypothetical protein